MAITIDLVSDDEDCDEAEPKLIPPRSRHNLHHPRHTHLVSTRGTYEIFGPLSISKESRRCLEPGRMLNDDIVHFYMKYLMDRQPQDKIHVFNSFFYLKFKHIYMKMNKLTPEYINQWVRRWDKDVRVFDKDFLVIPICDHAHWLLMIVAFPQSTILTIDSMRFKYLSKFYGFLREVFLPYRWAIERPNEGPRNFASRNLLKESYPLVTKQKNAHDCGIHMLYSFEKFLKKPTDVEDLSSNFEVDTHEMRRRIKSLLPQD